jgi:hypothetical protein
MSQTALGQSAVRVERRAKRRPIHARTRMVDRIKVQADTAGNLYQRFWREMDRAQKAYLSIVAGQESPIHKVDAAYQRYDLATRAFNHFLKATAA